MKKYSFETTVGIFVVMALFFVGYLAIKPGRISALSEGSYPLYARFTTAAGLRVDSAVSIYGIEVGRVKSLKIDTDRKMVLVGLELRKDIKIYDDASATVKTVGAIGDKYIRIDPGGSGEILKAGATITETSVPTDIEDLIGKVAFGDVKKEPAKAPKQTAK